MAYADLMKKSGDFASALDAVESILRDAGVADGRIGIDELGYSAPTYADMRKRLPDADFVEANESLRYVRSIKTPEELERLRAAAQLNEAAFLAMKEVIEPNRTVADAQRQYRRSIAELGGEFAFSSTGGGVMGGAPWMNTELMTLEAGDIIRFDGVMRFDDYWSDFGRTLAVGHVDHNARAAYSAIFAGYNAALSQIRHGASINAIFTAGLTAVRDAGLQDFDRHHIGHGIGLHPYDHPVVSPAPGSMYSTDARDAVLERGMVLCIEVPYYKLGLGGWQIEDTVVVTDDGYEYITTIERDIVVC
jgi:Xaa-Pro aminopeptidase